MKETDSDGNHNACLMCMRVFKIDSQRSSLINFENSEMYFCKICISILSEKVGDKYIGQYAEKQLNKRIEGIVAECRKLYLADNPEPKA